MKKNLFIFFIFFYTANGYSQDTPQKNYESFQAFLAEQNKNISKIKNDFNEIQVSEIMGSSIVINIPKTKKMKALNQLFKQPEFVNKYESNPALIVDVLYFFTTPKDQNGLISKNECTPVILENNLVVGTGWSFLQKYRRTGKMR